MSVELKVPPLPESVTDATLVAWHRKAGEAVRRDENLVDLETDKVVLEVPAPADGVLKEIRVADGATVTSGDVLAVLDTDAQPQSGASESKPAAEKPASGQIQEKEAAGAKEKSAQQDSAPESQAGASEGTESDANKRIGPAARSLIEEHDLDPAAIDGSGREGRITKSDVLGYLEANRDTNVGHESVSESAEEEPSGRRVERRVPMTRLRARIAERLVEAQQTAAMLTTFNEVDMSAIIALRKRYQERFQARYDIKLGFMSFFIRAAIEALKEFPAVNASIDGTEVVYHEYFDIGVAVSTDRGLLVPVIRDAQDLGLAQLEKAIVDYGTRARKGEIGMDDLTGGTFTITNGGIFGSMMSTPILNPPQSAILGMHKIDQRPVVVDGEIVARPMMYLALTYDHRIIDGREAVQFLVQLKEQLEDPARLVLQI